MKDSERLIEELYSNDETVINADLRRVLADALEDEKSYEQAEAHRWLVENQKRPYLSPSDTNGLKYCWFNQATISRGLGDEESDIPESIYKCLKGMGQEVANHKKYQTWRAAEDDFVKAWLEARAAGWSPNTILKETV